MNVRNQKKQVTDREIDGRIERENTSYITLLNVVSCVAVVFLHTNGCFWAFSRERYWMTANVIESVFYFAVPILFMITGATLMDYRERYSTGQYFRKRIQKTVIPFLLWSVIAIFYSLRMSWIQAEELSPMFILNGILNTRFMNIYWFFIPLFCIYMAIPLFSAVEKEKRKEVFSYLAVLCFLVNSLIPFLIRVTRLNLNWPFTVDVGGGYLIFILIGYLLRKYELSGRMRAGVYVCAAAGLLLMIVGTYRESMAAGSIVETFKGYTNVTCISYSVGIFVLAKKYGSRIMESRIGHMVRVLSGYTFGIYLTHIYIMNAVKSVFRKLLDISDVSLIYRLGAPFCIIPLAVLILYLLRKIKPLRILVP